MAIAPPLDRPIDPAGGGSQPAANPPPPRTGWLRTLRLGGPALPMFVLFVVALVDEMDRSAIGVLTPEIRDYFGLDLTTVTIVVSLTGVVTLLLALPMGFLADRVSRTKLTALGALSIGVFGILTGIVPTILLFTITRAAAGFGRTLDSAHNSLLADYYPPESRATVYSWRQLAVELGRGLGPLI